MKKPKSKKRLFVFVVAELLSIVVLLYVIVAVYGTFSFTSAPSRALGPDTPARYGIKYREVSFQTAARDKLTLRGWWLPRPASKRVLIALHGKGTNRVDVLELSSKLWENDYNVLLFDMRGHGQSDGDHFSFGQYEQFDIVGAVNFLKDQGFQPTNIGIIARSMGAASAIMAMSQTSDIKAGFMDSAYADFGELAQQQITPTTGLPPFVFPGITLAGRVLLGIDVEQPKPEVAISNIGQRHLFLTHGELDSLIPVSHFERLKQAGGANVTESWLVAGAEHIQAYYLQPTEYIRRVVAFFDRELR